MKRVDFMSEDFKFIYKPDAYYLPGEVECEGDYTDWKPQKKVNSGWGMFRGLTMETYAGYIGQLPRPDGDTCSFSEFNILYRGVDVSEWTYEELVSLVETENRDKKIEEVLVNEPNRTITK